MSEYVSDSTNTTDYTLPPNSTDDYDFLLELRRGVCQKIAGLKEQLQGERQILNSVERRMERIKGSYKRPL